MNREPYRWRTLALFDVHRSQLWQTVIVCGAVAAGLLIVLAVANAL